MKLSDLQAEVRPWAEHNFPDAQPHWPLLGAVEEIGELSHSMLKSLQGIRGTLEEHEAAMKDAVADCIIFFAHFANLLEFDLGDVVFETWEKVRQRDWKRNPTNGIDG